MIDAKGLSKKGLIETLCPSMENNSSLTTLTEEAIENPNKLHKFKKVCRKIYSKLRLKENNLLRHLFLVAWIVCIYYVGEKIQTLFTISDCNYPSKDIGQEELKVLMISDCQLLGYHESPWPLWTESDHYMSNLYQTLITKYKPEVVFHLGDSINEGGYKSTDDNRFKSYVERFKSIFVDSLAKDIRFINVIGNRDAELYLPISHSKVKRWESYFGSSQYSVEINGITFAILNSISLLHLWHSDKDIPIAKDSICLMHYPLAVFNNLELESFLKSRCRHIFSGHEHVYLELFGSETLIPTFSPTSTEHTPGFALLSISKSNLSLTYCPAPNRNTFIASLAFLWLVPFFKLFQKPKTLRRFLILMAVVYFSLFLYLNAANLGLVFIPFTYLTITTFWFSSLPINKYIKIVMILANSISFILSVGLIIQFISTGAAY